MARMDSGLCTSRFRANWDIYMARSDSWAFYLLLLWLKFHQPPDAGALGEACQGGRFSGNGNLALFFSPFPSSPPHEPPPSPRRDGRGDVSDNFPGPSRAYHPFQIFALALLGVF